MPLTYRGYNVQVEVEGEELPQFQVERTDERTITCWIPSEAGKAFLVRTSTEKAHMHEYKSVRLFADGRKLQGFGSRDELGEIIQYRVLERTREPFVFSEVAFELADEDGDGLDASNITEDIGVIEVQIWPTVPKKNKNGKLMVERSHAVDAGIKLSEKSKLIGANHVKPGVAEPYERKPDNVRYSAIGTQPYGVFRFKHRPKALLQALGVMPRPARIPTPPIAHTSRRARSPDPQEASNKRRRIDNDVEEDVKPILGGVVEGADARRRQIEERMAALQAELAGLDSQEPVKAERAPSPITVPQHGEVIDLTLDD